MVPPFENMLRSYTFGTLVLRNNVFSYIYFSSRRSKAVVHGEPHEANDSQASRNINQGLLYVILLISILKLKRIDKYHPSGTQRTHT